MINEKEINHLRWRTADEVVKDLKDHLSAVIISRASIGVFPMWFEYGVDVPKPTDDKNRYIVRTLVQSLRESGFGVKVEKNGLMVY